MCCGIQRVMFTEELLAKLKADTGVEPWSFEQYSDEAVFIPAGCPHQVGAGACICCARSHASNLVYRVACRAVWHVQVHFLPGNYH